MLGVGERPAGSLAAGRDRSRERVLRLHGEVSRRGLRADYPREADEGGDEESAAVGARRVPGGGLRRAGARRFPHGSKHAEDIFERKQYHAGFHSHQHVSQVVGGFGRVLRGTDRAADSFGARALRGKEEEPVQPVTLVPAPRGRSDPHSEGSRRKPLKRALTRLVAPAARGTRAQPRSEAIHFSSWSA